MNAKKLTPKQEMFVAEYLKDLNASAAARRAGYTGDPNTVGPRLLANVGVRSRIEQAKAKRVERLELTQDRVLLELCRLAFFDIRKLYREDGSMKTPHELDDDTAAALASLEVFEEFSGVGKDRVLMGYTKKAKAFDKGGAITLAMRHMGMLKDKLEVETTVVGLAERMRKQRGA